MAFLFALSFLVFILLAALLRACWFSPERARRRLRENGITGPPPSFPFGNLKEMRNKSFVHDPSVITHNIYSVLFPYFSRWRKLYGNLFVYWVGTEPFLYIGDPEFLREMASKVVAKSWRKPTVFRSDRKPMFGNGLLMAEGDEWVHQRQIIAPAFSPSNLKTMMIFMVETTTRMLDEWTTIVNSGSPEVDVEREMNRAAAEIIAKASFGISYNNGKEVFQKLRELQRILFKSNRLVGVPCGNLIQPKQTLKLQRLGKEIDQLLLAIVTSRKMQRCKSQHDLLGLLVERNSVDGMKLTTQELVDQCKTFFFGGHETTALALTWTLLLLALHPEWQQQLREEIIEVTRGGPLDFPMLAKLKKMNWMMNEVLRLYSVAPNVTRQVREDIQVGDVVIPSGTNLWIDVLGMNHDPTLWGDDVYEFKPERFKEGLMETCKHRMGFLPIGFGGRMCVGQNLAMMEYKVVLTMVLKRFSMSVSSKYCHSPTILFSLRPSHGVPPCASTPLRKDRQLYNA